MAGHDGLAHEPRHITVQNVLYDVTSTVHVAKLSRGEAALVEEPIWKKNRSGNITNVHGSQEPIRKTYGSRRLYDFRTAPSY
ncbi:hypothetical protein Dda_1146 [Drechslerella dactyloides]|uniref:Uncharacterized protein n=1 Tax=Drechslerella dactyloides TaxID=74499 RepID=A0AAD6J8M0_DREDA|nr:hypothetical protein Dda_1146 [Drechslerella dactyloides]